MIRPCLRSKACKDRVVKLIRLKNWPEYDEEGREVVRAPVAAAPKRAVGRVPLPGAAAPRSRPATPAREAVQPSVIAALVQENNELRATQAMDEEDIEYDDVDAEEEKPKRKPAAKKATKRR